MLFHKLHLSLQRFRQIQHFARHFRDFTAFFSAGNGQTGLFFL
jgi:hypothetical protein